MCDIPDSMQSLKIDESVCRADWVNAITIYNKSNELVVALKYDGSVEYGPGFTTNEAAGRVLWEAIGRSPLVCYAVSYSNYEPSELDRHHYQDIESLWATREKAESRAKELGDMWQVHEWRIQ